MYERVTKSEHRLARSLAHETITKLHGALRGEYTFYSQYVGSCKWGTVTRDVNLIFDIDYQIVLTQRSKVFKESGKFDPTKTKKRFMGKIQKILESSS